jgi:hypothetical protein
MLARALPIVVLVACGSVDRDVACEGGAVEVLDNADFDAAEPPWLQDPPGLLCGAPTITPDSGTVAACMGQIDGITNTVSQEILLPEGAAGVRLTGRICIATAETEAADIDVVSFDILDGLAPIAQLGTFTNQDGAAACQFVDFSLQAAIADDPVSATFRIQSTLDPDRPTSFFVDSLTLEVDCQ